MPERWFGTRVLVKTGDITQEEVDAIVNAANPSLMGGGGVDGAIHRAGGPAILEECKQIRRTQYPNGLPTGEAVITTGGNLKAKHVIHTVGPVWKGGTQNEPELLRRCYWNSLKLAAENGLKTIAFPAISTGVYGYPPDQAAQVASRAVSEFLKQDDRIERVVFVLFGEEAYRTFIEHCEFDVT
ncbi:MAG: O-acetyl-ADP-ribose deacetylase [Candidatus Poribacteria bacterium]|nr:MAG: O-acetyl-ADP-ribose deacetylase [Candidatus Poribacteria bacterium]